MDQVTGADLAQAVGTALDAAELAVDRYRAVTNLTGTERKRLNEEMDDFAIQAERLKMAHQRLCERAGAIQPGG